MAATSRDSRNSSASATNCGCEDVTREDVVDFLSSLYKEKLDSRSVARYLVSLRGLYKFAMMEDMVTTDPTENLESPKVRSSLPTYLRVEEMDKLLQAPNLATPLGLRDRAMLEVLYSTGLRVSELLNLRISDIDMRIGCVRCIGKGDKERLVPIGRKAIEAVEQYLAQARPKFAQAVESSAAQSSAVSDEHWQEAQPRRDLEDPARLWSAAGLARAPHAAQAAPQFCHAPARRGCGPPLGPAHAGPRGYFHDADLHARGRGALETDLQGASPARVKAKSQFTGRLPWRDKFDRVRGRREVSGVSGRGRYTHA